MKDTFSKGLHIYRHIASISLEKVNNEGLNIIGISPAEVQIYRGRAPTRKCDLNKVCFLVNLLRIFRAPF